MMRALVVYCHPLSESFTEAMCSNVLAGLEVAGAEVRVSDLYADGFDPAYTAADHANFRAHRTDQTLTRYFDDLAWCDTLIIVYPTWWAGLPSMLTGWVDRVWACDATSHHYSARQSTESPRTNITQVVAVTSHGSTKLINVLEGEAGRYTLTRAMRSRCHRLVRTEWIALYAIDTSSLAQREAFLRKVKGRISKLR